LVRAKIQAVAVHELLTPSEMAEADRRTIGAGTPGAALMERAGKAVADAVLDRHEAETQVIVVCGPGNNGGDGFVAARLLAERGCPVRVMLLGRAEALSGDAAGALRRWPGETGGIDANALGEAGLIVDALFGGGLGRPLAGPAAEAVEAINRAGKTGIPVLAVDLPSGIDGATGLVRGVAVKANETITFCRRKPGHLLLPGRSHAGKVRVADIGISAATIASVGPKTFENEPALWRELLPSPQIDGHKYDRGHVVVASGPVQATGAARLAARAALRAGAGLVTVAGPKNAIPVLAASLTAIMVRWVDDAAGLKELLADKRLNAVLLGPGQGAGTRTKNMVIAAAKAKRALVLDADALTSFAGQASFLAKAVAPSPAIITPHRGEFERLFSRQPRILEIPSKAEMARTAAKLVGATLLLKGADTVVAAPNGRVAIADNAPPWLATAGAGDVLAGMVAGLAAQGMPPFEAACAGVWLHGECGRDAGRGLIAEDLPEALPGVLQRLFSGKR
jgi:hydroxyethylthiazole kinase-like uncharacterized protein yjeF